MTKNLKKIVRKLRAGHTNASEFANPVNYPKAIAILERKK